MNYDQDRALHTYLLFHYGSRADILSGSALESTGAILDEAYFQFPVHTARLGGDLSAGARALDLGCAVGRSTFEFSKVAAETVGIDYSRAFIEAAEALRRGEKLDCLRYSEAHRADPCRVSMPSDARPDRVRFLVGDAMELPADLGAFDLVHAANLLCRLSAPRRLLDRLSDLVKPGGRLVLATPATWLEDYTPRPNQPAGPTLDWLRTILEPQFTLHEVVEMPFLLREHARKFQISTSQTSLWERTFRG